MSWKLIKTTIFFLVLFISQSSFAYINFYFNTGAASISHKEFHYEQSSLDTDIPMYLLATEVGFKLPLGTRLLAISADFQYLGPNLSSSATQKVTYMSYNAKFIFKIPSEPFNIDVSAEYFSDTCTPSATTFGYDDTTGIKYNVNLNMFVPKFNFRFDVDYPITYPVEGLTHYKAAFKYFFELGEAAKGKDVQERGSFLKLTYEYKKIHDSTAADPIDIRVRTMGAMFGVHF